MANINSASGFRPVATLSGKPFFVMPFEYTAKANTEICPGDVLTITDGGTSPIVEPCTAGSPIFGIAANYVSATATDRRVRIYDTEDIVFEVQMTGAFAADDVGKCADHVVATGAANTGPFGTAGAGRSAHYLSDTVAATGGFKIRQLAPGSVVGAYAKVYVTVNEGMTRTGVNGIADA